MKIAVKLAALVFILSVFGVMACIFARVAGAF